MISMTVDMTDRNTTPRARSLGPQRGCGVCIEPRPGERRANAKLRRPRGSGMGWSAGFLGLALSAGLSSIAMPAFGQGAIAADAAAARAAVAGEVAHAQRMHRLFPDAEQEAQPTPAVIPAFEVQRDPTGVVATVNKGGPTITAKNAFFQSIGTNNRTCFTCHQPQDGWSISARHVQRRFKTDPDEPLFRLVDGATCPSDDVTTLAAKQKAFSLLLERGLIRIGIPMPSQNLQFEVIGVSDPYGCSTSPVTGLTSPRTGTVSVYRRPLPSTNLGFLSTIMWDGREADLFSQAADATLGHAQASAAPTLAQSRAIVAFEGCTGADTPTACATLPSGSGLFTAQLFDQAAQRLDYNADGGPVYLAQQVGNFFIGTNDPLGLNPTAALFSSDVFNLYSDWGSSRVSSPVAAARAAIARGEQVFNTIRINITGVAGLNDALNQPVIPGFCGTCHDTPTAGNHSVKAPLDIGVADAGNKAPPVLNIAGLPVFTLWCTTGPLAGQILEVTDPGRALITGKCADIGKLKGPILRGLAARAPYFHNGSAATLRDVVDFYDQRFAIGLTEQQKKDLVAFLNAL
jgi:cytochrome c peroxidase